MQSFSFETLFVPILYTLNVARKVYVCHLIIKEVIMMIKIIIIIKQYYDDNDKNINCY